MITRRVKLWVFSPCDNVLSYRHDFARRTRPGCSCRPYHGATGPLVSPPTGRGDRLGSLALDLIPARRVELAGLAGPHPPLLDGGDSARTVKTYVSAWLGGLTFWVLAVQWLRLTDASAWPGWLLVALLCSLWWPGFLGLTRLAVHQLRIPLMLAAPIIWVGLEYVRAYFLSGFPWYYLAHSQFRALYVIQIADVTGSLGVSLLIAVTNAWLVNLATLPLLRTVRGRSPRLCRRQYVRLCVMTTIWGSTLCYGVYRISTAAFRNGPKLALLQSNIEQSHKMKGDPNAIAREFQQLLATAMSRADRPELIVWPETSYPFGFISIDPGVEKATLERQVRSISPTLSSGDWIDKQQAIADNLHSWTDELGVPMLVGTLFYDHQPGALERYNSCILFEPNLRPIHFYHKMHLVPFGEYVPFVETLPWLVALTPYRGDKVPQAELRSRRIHPASRKLSPGGFDLFRGHDSPGDPPVLRSIARRTPARSADQRVQRRLVSQFRRARHASGDRRVSGGRTSSTPRPGRQYGAVGAVRRQRRDSGRPAQGHKRRPFGDRATGRSHQPLLALGRLARLVVSGHPDRLHTTRGDQAGPGSPDLRLTRKTWIPHLELLARSPSVG